MRQIGKKTKRWLAFRKQWIKDNPPNHQNYYTCHICHQAVPLDEMTLDHVISRSRDPSLVFVAENVKPAHYLCNSQKGSGSL